MMPHAQTLWNIGGVGGVGVGGGVITFGWMCLEDDATCTRLDI